MVLVANGTLRGSVSRPFLLGRYAHAEIDCLVAEDRDCARCTLFARHQGGKSPLCRRRVGARWQRSNRSGAAISRPKRGKYSRNIKAIVEAGGGRMSDIVKTTVYITDMANFAAMNEVYKTYFPSEPPGRATVKADLVNYNFLIEIDAIAAVG
jgi:hypothetical protein